MSGIAGLLNLDGQPADRRLLSALTSYMAFRGPDGQAMWAGGPVGLGHALLKTTPDVAAEKQPLSVDGQVWITADARLDGRAELIDALRAKRAHGQDARAGASDAALVLRAYLAWGPDCLARLQGDFTFAIWDAREQRLLCARDPYGIAPFYYAQLPGCFLFSNTLNCLLLHPGVSERLNEQAIADLLVLGGNQDLATTTYADIQRLPPAHSLLVSAGQVHCRRYWSPPETELRVRPARETIDTFAHLFEQAVADRVRDERLAVTLSGGMDSTSVAVVAAAQLKARGSQAPIIAYNIRADHLMPDDEASLAAQVAEAAGITMAYVPVPALPAELPESEERLPPEPGFILALSPFLPILRQASEGGRVMLGGMGGDPLLSPTPGYLLRLLAGGRWLRLVGAVGQHLRWHGRLPPPYLRSAIRRWRGISPVDPGINWLEPAFAARAGIAERRQSVMAAQKTQDQRLGMASQPFWANLFAYSDPGFTGFPIRQHHPFFDARLVNFMRSVPPIPWLEGKLLLREAMRGRLPESVRQRRKTPAAGMALQLQASRQPASWMARLAQAPELTPFVKQGILLRVVSFPGHATMNEFGSAFTALTLAYWLRHRRRPERIVSDSIYLEDRTYDPAS